MNESSSTAATVNETPSTAIEPFSTTYRSTSAGARIADALREPVLLHLVDRADAVDVTLHDVAAEPVGGAQRQLEIDRRADRDLLQRAARKRLVHDIGGEIPLRYLDRRQADAVDRDRVALVQLDSSPSARIARRTPSPEWSIAITDPRSATRPVNIAALTTP